MPVNNFINESACPLCGGDNACAELGKNRRSGGKYSCENSAQCWCQKEGVRFPALLLDDIPDDKKGKACVCQRCVQIYNQ